MYVNVVDELVDFVFDGGGAVVVFLFERLGNLYTQSVIRNLISRDFFFTQIRLNRRRSATHRPH